MIYFSMWTDTNWKGTLKVKLWTAEYNKYLKAKKLDHRNYHAGI